MSGTEHVMVLLLIFILEGIGLGIVCAGVGLIHIMKITDSAPKKAWIRIFLELFGYTVISFWAILAFLCGISWFLWG